MPFASFGPVYEVMEIFGQSLPMYMCLSIVLYFNEVVIAIDLSAGGLL